MCARVLICMQPINKEVRVEKIAEQRGTMSYLSWNRRQRIHEEERNILISSWGITFFALDSWRLTNPTPVVHQFDQIPRWPDQIQTGNIYIYAMLSMHAIHHIISTPRTPPCWMQWRRELGGAPSCMRQPYWSYSTNTGSCIYTNVYTGPCLVFIFTSEYWPYLLLTTQYTNLCFLWIFSLSFY